MEAIDDCSKHGREWTDYTIQGCGFGEEAGARSQDAGGGAFEVLPWVYVLSAAMMEFFFKADTLIIADNTILVQNETVFLKGCFVRTVLIQDECCSHCTTEKVLRSYKDYRNETLLS